MRLLLLLPLICLYALPVSGQQLNHAPVSTADSLVRTPSERLDSAHQVFYQNADLLKAAHKQKLASIDSSQQHIQSTIDSLQKLQLPVDQYVSKLDSLEHERQKTVTSLNNKVNTLKERTTAGIRSLGLPSDLQDKVDGVTNSIESFQLPARDLNIPDLNLPDNPFRNLDGVNTSVSSPFGEVGNVTVPDVHTGQVKIPGVDGLEDLSDVTGKAGAYGKELKEIANGGNLDNAQQLSTAVEEKAAAAAGVEGLPDANKTLQDMTKTPVPLNGDPAAQVQQVQDVAVNHFAGKEKQLQEAMDKMAKLKKKYSSLNSLSEIPKKRPNEMRGRPLIERILPGVALQFAGKGDEIFADINPYAGYRFNGRLTAGMGWNHRISFNTKHYWFTDTSPVYGPRAFGEYKIGKGFAPRVEVELMNTLIPATVLKINSEIKYKQWVPGVFVGIKKDYQFFRNVRGTGMIMFRMFNPSHKSPYADVLNVRVGFEFPMKKKKRS